MSLTFLAYPHSQPSVFWRDVLWAAQALKFGYRWVVGDGTKVRFWKDTWFGTAPLATQFWDLFCICNQTGVPLASVWNGVEVKLTFRRNSNEEMMERWYELRLPLLWSVAMMEMLWFGNMKVMGSTPPNPFML